MKKFQYTEWTPNELRQIADGIYEKLGLNQDIDLERELIEHYKRCREAAEAAQLQLLNGETTAGAAAVLTATTGALKELARLQTELYNAERVKVLERAIIHVLKQQPNAEDLMDMFREQVGSTLD